MVRGEETVADEEAIEVVEEEVLDAAEEEAEEIELICPNDGCQALAKLEATAP